MCNLQYLLIVRFVTIGLFKNKMFLRNVIHFHWKPYYPFLKRTVSFRTNFRVNLNENIEFTRLWRLLIKLIILPRNNIRKKTTYWVIKKRSLQSKYWLDIVKTDSQSVINEVSTWKKSMNWPVGSKNNHRASISLLIFIHKIIWDIKMQGSTSTIRAHSRHLYPQKLAFQLYSNRQNQRISPVLWLSNFH